MKNVLITGVGRGIGRALAEKFATEGWRVIGTTYQSTSDLPQGVSKHYALDLSDEASIKNCVENLKKDNITIDVLINNAGILCDEEETHLVPDKLRQTLEVNLIGTADFTEQLLPLLNQSGHVVFLSSQAGSLQEMDHLNDSHEPYHYPAYKISKTALNMYVRTLAARLLHEGNGTIVSAVHPGWVQTDMGGSEAPITPAEAATQIFKLATSRPPTGGFWYNDEPYPW